MRWMTTIGGLALALLVTAGCKQQCFLSECDFNHYKDIMPLALETKPMSIAPPGPVYEPDPPTVLNPDRPIRYLSLAEAIAIALERGNVGDANPNSLLGVQGVRGPGFASDNIRVLALNPAIAGAAVDLSLSKFDTVWNTGITWNNVDRPVGTPLDTFQTGATGVGAIEQAEANFNTGLLKPLPTGGVAGITFNTDYQFTNLPARVNPSYRPALQFQFEQPLLQGYGVEINQLRGRHPGNLFTPGRLFNLQPTQEGILLTRLRFDQERAEFERRVQQLLFNVESAYWNLYGSYMVLFAQEQGLRAAYEAWKITYERFKVGRVSETTLAQAKQNYELSRSQRLGALGTGVGTSGSPQPGGLINAPGVLEAERQMRNLLNLPIQDGYRLVPSDAPTLAPYRPDWNTALNEALTLRPELILARQEVKTRQLNLIEAKNNLLPDLRAFATYDINAIGTRLDGPLANNAFRNLASNHFNNWQLGLNLIYPIGFRQAHANVRIARLNLAQSYALLKEQELRTQRALAFPYQRLFETYEQIAILRSQRETVAQQLRGELEIFRVGAQRGAAGEAAGQFAGTLAAVLQAQQLWANALSTEINAIIAYNVELASFELNKGTLLRHNNVHIAEGPLPHCAQVRAVEHERQRTKALVLATRPDPSLIPDCCPDGGAPAAPDSAPPLPAVLKAAPPLPQVPPEQLKMPRPVGPNGPKPAPVPGAAPSPPGPKADKVPNPPAPAPPARQEGDRPLVLPPPGLGNGTSGPAKPR